MAKFKKAALSVGKRVSPDGPVDITPARLKHWRAEHQRMRKNGYDVPIAFDHADTLDKLQPVKAEERKKRSAKDTVGFLDSIKLAKDGQRVELELDVTDRRANEQAESNRVYVSPVILPEWRDGAGNVYKDVITHVDLVNHPVDFTQGPFEKLPAVEPGFVACALRMGLSAPLRMGLSAPLRMGEFPPEEDEPEGDDEPTDVEVDDENPDLPADDSADKQLEAVIAQLATLNVVLPVGTTKDDLIPHLLTALMTANAHKAQADAEDKDDDTNDLGEPIAKDPGYAAMSADAQAAHGYAARLHQRDIARDLQELLNTGRVTPAEFKAKSKEVAAVRLSLDASGNPQVTDLEKWIESRKPLPPGTFFDPDQKTRLSAQTIEVPIGTEPTEEETKSLAKWALTGQR